MQIRKIICLNKNLHYLSIVLYILIICIYNSICTTDFDYQLEKRLNNGNYLIMSSEGIYFYNELFNMKQTIVKFGSRLAGSQNDMNSADIAQFLSEDGGYIICLIINKVFIISKSGEYLYNFTLDYIQDNHGYQIIPYKKDGNSHHYFAILTSEIDSIKRIDIRTYIYDSNANNVDFGGYYNYTLSNNIEKYIACELMKYENEKVIFCFYGEWNILQYVIFETETFEPIANRSGDISLANLNGGQFFISSVNSTKRENVVCCSQREGELKCFEYNIITNKFSEVGIITESGCLLEKLKMQIEYFPETFEFLMGCQGNNNYYFIGKFFSNNNFNIYNKTQIIPSSGSSFCYDTNLFHFIYDSGHYSLLTDAAGCKNNRLVTIDYIESTPFQEYPTDEIGITFTCSGYILYDTSGCVDDIPSGYFNNDTSSKILYKCHDNCRTCDKGGTDENNNCKRCPTSGKIYLDLGNCTNSCHGRGHFTHPDHSSLKLCNCSIQKCLYCTQESLANNEFCEICNTDEGFYPIKNDPTAIGSFINCYQNLSGYYLENKKYRPCYSTCKNCYGPGNAEENNCKECDDDHIFDSNKNNCYSKCTHYYYFNESGYYQCADNCPNNYKLIYSTTKCILDCSDTGYKYEYNQTCYENCPPGTFYSYDHTKCLNEVPDGYFCNNTDEQTIDQCHQSCGTCIEKGDDNNNKCLTCKSSEITENIYLDSGNCVSSCANGNFFNDPEDESILRCKCSESKCLYCSKESLDNNLCILCYKEGGYYPKKDDDTSIAGPFIDCFDESTISGPYYLNEENEQYEKCYSSCASCSVLGGEDNHQCNKCLDGYDPIINNNNYTNCYERCDHFYYFDTDENYKYKCTNNDNCPSGYKLINSTNKCIDDCAKDNIYNSIYEYQNKCYNKLLCEHYYNYEHIACIDTIEEGYYCNSTSEQTIDKCHKNCKTCKEGGTDDNNNCQTCKDEGTKYFDFGNCKETCENGNFTDDLILKCKCTQNKSCEKCDKDINGLYLCKTCNNEEGYYIKSDDEERNDGFINCYKNPEGYYLENNIYYPCYETCKHCLSLGNGEDNKCSECKDGYKKTNDLMNDNICYKNCDYEKYYYYDNNNGNNYTCTTDNNCPEQYQKLISAKKRCIDDCSKDNIYRYEYNGICISGCPPGTHTKTDNEYMCEGDLNCEKIGKYYNYDFTSCTDGVEEGYYCNDTSLKTVAKCHDNCKTCLEGPTDENNNCETCKDEGTKYFDFGNCRETCENGNFIDDLILKCKCTQNKSCEKCDKDINGLYLCKTCNNEEGYYIKSDDEERNDGFVNCYKNLEGYYLDLENKEYRPCYNSCKLCDEKGSEENNKCTVCKEGYERKEDFENDNNCYEICDFYYYYDSNNKYKCTDINSCPMDFNKLIPDKKRCIIDCNIVSLYEYNNECKNECPSGHHIINNKCIENLNCENKGKYYNYEKTECLDNITEGFYCNDTFLKTIDKCHSNCKTCLEEGTDEKNNCKTCKDEGTKFFDLGNCKTTCKNGNFLDKDKIYKCKCSENKACKLCSFESNQNNLCISCNTDDNYYPKINDKNDNNSLINCYNEKTISCENYFYLNQSYYYCTPNKNCIDEFKFLIPEKNKCIDDCSKDNRYKFQFENICYESCPKNTKSKDNKNMCELSENNSTKIEETVDDLVKIFPVENVTCENDYVDVEDKENYIIYIYQNNECPEGIKKHPSDKFDCYDSVKEINNIDKDDELIVSKVINKENNILSYSFYDPNTLDKLDSSPCKKVTVENSLNEKIKNEMFINLIEQGINIFSPSDPFFTDICYHYESPNGKDVPVKVRLAAFHPNTKNITLCEKGCENVGIDIKTMKAKCECKFIDVVNIDMISNNVYGEAIQEILDIISELNIAVLKCIKDIFKKENFVKSTGGFIIISLFAGQLICFIKYAIDGLYYIRKYIFTLTDSYINYQGGEIFKKDINLPPKRKKKGKNMNILNINNISYNQSKIISDNSNNTSKKGMISKEQKNSLLNNKANNKLLKLDTIRKKNSDLIYKNHTLVQKIKIYSNNNEKNNFDMREYLSISFDENDFDDVIDKESRKFCQYFCEKFKMNQIFINTFFIKEDLRPRSLKILVLIMTIELYFLLNALFYNEDYLSNLFYSNKEEKFYSFIPRRFNEFIYTSAVSGFISYLVGYVFVDEEKIKKIFRRHKEADIKMRYELSLVIKDIENKFTTIIIISLVLTIFCFIYFSCFNYVYPYIKIEWIKSSLFILIIMQFINVLMIINECILRYAAIKCKSERIFKLSQIFDL